MSGRYASVVQQNEKLGATRRCCAWPRTDARGKSDVHFVCRLLYKEKRNLDCCDHFAKTILAVRGNDQARSWVSI